MIHAGGGNTFGFFTTGSDVHPLRITLSSNTQLINFNFCIS
ncbi:hypothetical protein LL668_06860 [Providencia rettgeri]|nr:hypothetical protein LL668_06860 [Providencia rettgeri]